MDSNLRCLYDASAKSPTSALPITFSDGSGGTGVTVNLQNVIWYSPVFSNVPSTDPADHVNKEVRVIRATMLAHHNNCAPAGYAEGYPQQQQFGIDSNSYSLGYYRIMIRARGTAPGVALDGTGAQTMHFGLSVALDTTPCVSSNTEQQGR